MSVDLAPDVWNEIQRQLASGSYTSPDDVLRDALAALRSREEEVLAIQEGIDDMEAGRTMPIREFDREFQRFEASTPDEQGEIHAAIRQGLADIRAGRGRPAELVMNELRGKYGLSPQ